MKLLLEVFNLDGTLARSQEVPVKNPNSLKHMGLPMLGTFELYQLKKNGKVDIQTDIGFMTYSLQKEAK